MSDETNEAPAPPAWPTIRDRNRVRDMTEAEVLAASDNGKLGPGLVGVEIFTAAALILKARGGGMFGPAIMDPEHARKEAAARPARPVAQKLGEDLVQTGEPFDGDAMDAHPDNPWHYVTLAGAKMLAQKHGVSYKPKTPRKDLIPMLVKAGIVPPPVPVDANEDDDE